MDSQNALLPPRATDVDAALAQAASLVRDGLLAFLEGNPFRGRRVQEAARHLLVGLEAWQEQALESWPDDPWDFERQLTLANHIEELARAAQQLGALAESRPSMQIQSNLREQVRRLASPLEGLLASLVSTPSRATGQEALVTLRTGKGDFLSWCATLSRTTPRLFSSCLLAVAASQRIEEAAEAAAAVADLLAQPPLATPFAA